MSNLVNQRGSTVCCFDFDAKQAALYVDYVVPFFPEVRVDNRSKGSKVSVQYALPNVLPPFLASDARSELESLRGDHAIALLIDLCVQALRLPDLEGTEWDALEGFFRRSSIYKGPRRRRHNGKTGQEFFEAATDYCRRYHLSSYPAILPNSDMPILNEDTSQAVAITLTGLRLIDVANLSWDHIVEFRRDERSRSAFRRLLQFFSESYAGKPSERIQEDLLMRLEAFNDVVDDWHFETIDTSLSLVLNSKILAASSVVSLASFCFNATPEAVLAGAIGAGVEFANLALHLRRRAYALHTMRRDHPLSYLISASVLKSNSPQSEESAV
jgi:hypothetical protein